MPEFAFTELLPLGEDETPYRLLTADGVRVVGAADRKFLEVDGAALRLLADTAMPDIAHLLRPAHLAQLRRWRRRSRSARRRSHGQGGWLTTIVGGLDE